MLYFAISGQAWRPHRIPQSIIKDFRFMPCTKPLFDTYQERPPKSHDEHIPKTLSKLNSKVNFFFPYRKRNSCERRKTVTYGPHIYLRCDSALTSAHIVLWSRQEGQPPCKKATTPVYLPQQQTLVRQSPKTQEIMVK